VRWPVAEGLPPAGSLHVLMIALGDQVLTGEGGDTRQRHLEYAERVGHLHMVVYSPRESDFHETTLSDHLTVYPTRSATRPGFILDAYRLGVEVCHAHPIDLITTQDPFTTGLPGVWLKRRFGIPLDVQNHSDFFDNREWIGERPLRNGFFNRLGKWVIRQADTHRVLNRAERDKYLRMGIAAERVAVLATPTRLDRFDPDGPPGEVESLRAALELPSGAPVLLWVGRPVRFKRVPLLVEAVALARAAHPDVQLILVGDFSARADVREQVARLRLSRAVHFVGSVPHESLPAYYRLADVYVHSSVYEGLGKVMIEAAASGTPVVSTRTAGAGEIVVEGETGLLCEPEDAADLAEKIVTLLDDPKRAAEMGAAGRTFVLGKFDHTRNMDAVVDTWRRTAALGGRG
jgi:glycosyltransferase involved in cell wall biosynthesis